MEQSLTDQAHPRFAPYTAHDLLELDDGWHRFEVWEGTLLSSPPPPVLHQLCGAQMRTMLDAVAPTGAIALTSVGVRMDGDTTCFVPDIVCFRMPEPGTELLTPADILVAVEITVSGTRQRDRVAKPAAYAEGGIPCYWRVELEPFPDQDDEQPPVVLVHELVGGCYLPTQRLPAGRTGRIEAPFPVEFDPAWLIEDFR